MTSRRFVSAAVLAAGLCGASAPVPLPPIRDADTSKPATYIVRLQAPTGSVPCAEGSAGMSEGDALPVFAVSAWSFRAPGAPPPPPPSVDGVTVTFDVDATGRPVNLSMPAPTSSPPDGGRARLYYDRQQMEAVVAGRRFPAGAPRTACRLEAVATATPLAEAPLADVLSAWNEDRVMANREDVLARVREPGSDCADAGAYPLPRELHFPDQTAAGRPGRRSWTMVRFDVGADGRTHAVAIRASSGDPRFDADGARAIARSRYASGTPRRACWMRFMSAPVVLAAPPGAPEADDPPDCPRDDALIRPAGGASYPPAFQRTAIEGWARIGFDVAPWGALGGVHVIAAEPADAFGEAGANLIRSSRAAPGQGASGCRALIKYKIGQGWSVSGMRPAVESAPVLN